MEPILPSTRYGEPVIHGQSATAPGDAPLPPALHDDPPQLDSPSTPRFSRLHTLRQSIVGFFSLPNAQGLPIMSTSPPTLPPISISSPPITPPAPLHVRPRATSPDPANVPPPPTATETPVLFGETTPYAAASHQSYVESLPRSETRTEIAEPRRRSLLDKLICPHPSQHALATVLIDSARRRQRNAWVRRKQPTVTSYGAAPASPDETSSPAPLLPHQQSHTGRVHQSSRHHRHHRSHRHDARRSAKAAHLHKHQNRLIRATVFGVFLIAFISTYLALALTLNGEQGHSKLPIGVHVLFILCIIFVTILFLHAFIRAVWLQPQSRSRKIHKHGRRRRARHAPRDMEAAPMRIGPNWGTEQSRDVEEEDQSSDEDETDRLPNDDALYTPSTPIRVHLTSDPFHEGKTAVAHAPVVVSPRGTVTSFDREQTQALRPHSSPHLERQRTQPTPVISPATPVAQRELHTGRRSIGQTATTPQVVQGANQEDDATDTSREQPREHEHDNDRRVDIADSRDSDIRRQDVTAPAAPPSYGEWRCSVRADPNLLFWARVTPASSPHTSSVAPAASPRLATAVHPLETDTQRVDQRQSQQPPDPTTSATSPIYIGLNSPRTPTAAPASTQDAATAAPPSINITVPSAPPAYSDIQTHPQHHSHHPHQQVHAQLARERSEGDWPLSAGFGGARMEEGIVVVLEDERAVVRGAGPGSQQGRSRANEANAESTGRGSGDGVSEGSEGGVVGLTRRLLRGEDGQDGFMGMSVRV
ncbi:MAG: hypothetical protein Q9159_004188 [Coniocarpon cinnabarinum]